MNHWQDYIIYNQIQHTLNFFYKYFKNILKFDQGMEVLALVGSSGIQWSSQIDLYCQDDRGDSCYNYNKIFFPY